MELLAAFFWLLVIAADIMFMRHIGRLADRLFPVHKKTPGGAATPTEGIHKMTDLVYHFAEENAR